MARKILICQYKTCPKQGANEVLKAFQSQILSDVVVESSGCLGECGNGPMVLILPDEIWYCNVQVKDVPNIVEQHLKRGKPIKKKLYPKYHPQKQSLRFGLIILVLCIVFLSLLFWFILSHTDYL